MALLLTHPLVDLHVKLVDRVSLVIACIPNRPGAVRLIFIYDKIACGLVPVNTVGFRAPVVLAEKHPHIFKRQIMPLTVCPQFFYCRGNAVGRPFHTPV
jgi:hypothetical protein